MVLDARALQMELIRIFLSFGRSLRITPEQQRPGTKDLKPAETMA